MISVLCDCGDCFITFPRYSTGYIKIKLQCGCIIELNLVDRVEDMEYQILNLFYTGDR